MRTKIGISHVLERRRVFPFLTVKQNLLLGAWHGEAKMQKEKTLDEIYIIFRILADRSNQLAHTMSGGEQQMLAIARGLMGIPKLLMVDEPFLGLSPKMIEKIKEIFDINFFSQLRLTQKLMKIMIKNKKGSILYISSSSALDGNEGRSAYSSAKAAIIAQAKVLSRELGAYNIRVNSIAPGLTNTDMMKENHQKRIVDDVVSRTSLRRVADPIEIANVVLLLSSELTSYITGQNIRVDGGM